ncbi:MAG: chloride channel protein [Burkholderiaceae bacterium]|nr:chloride channel protein [Burkholderiaceae bacterium]
MSGGEPRPAASRRNAAPGFTDLLGRLRRELAHADALVALSAIGVVAGVVVGVVIVAFRLVTEKTLVVAGLMDDAEHFEALTWHWRLALPVAGGLLVGLMFQFASVGARQVGPVHVMAQLASRAGRMPWRNALMQFVGGAVSIVCGHSVGREGPVIHVGAASASLLGQWLRLPNNSIRTLVACGVAGAIAASFNTPIAGVVFAMEVVMLEYTLVGFAPVILAAVSATSLSRLVYGADPAFAVPQMQQASLPELPWIVLLGLVVGCLAAAYVAGTRHLDRRSRSLPLALRTTAAGALTGLCALAVPQVMGLGYDTVQQALLGEIALGTLVAIALAKLAATVACGGLGLPGGLIGPMVVMGAAAGGALGIVGASLAPGSAAATGFYAMLGVAAMMGASLQAPLAALMAILELTGNAGVLLPGMAAVIPALLVARSVFGQDPIFVAILRGRGMDYRFDPVAALLDRTGVAAAMNGRFAIVDREAAPAQWEQALAAAPDWLLVADGDAVRAVLRPPAHAAAGDGDGNGNGARAGGPAGPTGAVDVAMAALREPAPFAIVSLHATLGEALRRLDEAGARLALVCSGEAARPGEVCGVVERQGIEATVGYRV